MRGLPTTKSQCPQWLSAYAGLRLRLLLDSSSVRGCCLASDGGLSFCLTFHESELSCTMLSGRQMGCWSGNAPHVATVIERLGAHCAAFITSVLHCDKFGIVWALLAYATCRAFCCCQYGTFWQPLLLLISDMRLSITLVVQHCCIGDFWLSSDVAHFVTVLLSPKRNST